jgi:sulfate permease, SulP family
VPLDSGGHVHDILIRFAGQAAEINPYATAVAVTTLVVGILVRRFLPVIPYMLAAMLAGGLTALGLDRLLGPEVTQIATVGALPASLPPLSAPSLTLEHIRALAPAALAVKLFALTEAVSIGRALGADKRIFRECKGVPGPD